MLKVYNRLVLVILIIIFFLIAYVKYNSFGVLHTALKTNDGAKILEQLPPNTGTTSKDQSSDNTFSLNLSVKPEDATKTKTVIQFRNLVNKLVHCADKCENITEQETLHLPSNILTDPTFLRVVERVRKSKEGCTNDSSELKAEISPDASMLLIRDSIHHLSICFNAKAASTSFVLYSKVLTIYNEITSKIQQLISKEIRRKFEMNGELNTLQGKKRDLPDSNMKVVVVRHPFQRLVSAYNGKVYIHKQSKGKMKSKQFQSMLSLSLLPDSETTVLLGRPKDKLKCSQNLKGTVGDLKPTVNSHGQKIPSFRGFVLGLIIQRTNCKGKLECMKIENRHTMSQVLRCGPCLMNYDAILKLETINEDITLIEKVLGIESAWKVQQQVVQNRKQEYQESTAESGNLATNSHEKLYSYRDYMNQLAPHEMNMLYEVYANDFNVFGYDPCQDINSTSQN